MYKPENISDIIKDELKKRELFLVDVIIRQGNRILVEIDGVKGVSIDDCVGISRKIESTLDRENEDFDLEVSSPGADKPFKVKEQYFKYLNKKVEIKTVDGIIYEGVLSSVNETGIELETNESIKKTEEKKKNQLQLVKKEINIDKIESARGLISFK